MALPAKLDTMVSQMRLLVSSLVAPGATTNPEEMHSIAGALQMAGSVVSGEGANTARDIIKNYQQTLRMALEKSKRKEEDEEERSVMGYRTIIASSHREETLAGTLERLGMLSDDEKKYFAAINDDGDYAIMRFKNGIPLEQKEIIKGTKLRVAKELVVAYGHRSELKKQDHNAWEAFNMKMYDKKGGPENEEDIEKGLKRLEEANNIVGGERAARAKSRQDQIAQGPALEKSNEQLMKHGILSPDPLMDSLPVTLELQEQERKAWEALNMKLYAKEAGPENEEDIKRGLKRLEGANNIVGGKKAARAESPVQKHKNTRKSRRAELQNIVIESIFAVVAPVSEKSIAAMAFVTEVKNTSYADMSYSGYSGPAIPKIPQAGGRIHS